MDAFAQSVGSWQVFYLMVGTAAATLIGLLFIGISLHIDRMRSSETRELLLLGGLTFNSFFYVLLFAIFFLIPGPTPTALGAELFLLGTLGLVSGLIQFNRAWKTVEVWRFVIPLVALIAVLVISLTVFAGQTGGFYWLVIVMVVLLVSASRNAWDFLLGVTRFRLPTPPSKED